LPRSNTDPTASLSSPWKFLLDADMPSLRTSGDPGGGGRCGGGGGSRCGGKDVRGGAFAPPSSSAAAAASGRAAAVHTWQNRHPNTGIQATERRGTCDRGGDSSGGGSSGGGNRRPHLPLRHPYDEILEAAAAAGAIPAAAAAPSFLFALSDDDDSVDAVAVAAVDAVVVADDDEEVTFVETRLVPRDDITESAPRGGGPRVTFQLFVRGNVTPEVDTRSLPFGELVDGAHEGGGGEGASPARLRADWFDAFERKVLRPLLRTRLLGEPLLLQQIGAYPFQEWDVAFAVPPRPGIGNADGGAGGWSDLGAILPRTPPPSGGTTVPFLYYVTLRDAARQDLFNLKVPEGVPVPRPVWQQRHIPQNPWQLPQPPPIPQQVPQVQQQVPQVQQQVPQVQQQQVQQQQVQQQQVQQQRVQQQRVQQQRVQQQRVQQQRVQQQQVQQQQVQQQKVQQQQVQQQQVQQQQVQQQRRNHVQPQQQQPQNQSRPEQPQNQSRPEQQLQHEQSRQQNHQNQSEAEPSAFYAKSTTIDPTPILTGPDDPAARRANPPRPSNEVGGSDRRPFLSSFGSAPTPAVTTRGLRMLSRPIEAPQPVARARKRDRAHAEPPPLAGGRAKKSTTTAAALLQERTSSRENESRAVTATNRLTSSEDRKRFPSAAEVSSRGAPRRRLAPTGDQQLNEMATRQGAQAAALEERGAMAHQDPAPAAQGRASRSLWGPTPSKACGSTSTPGVSAGAEKPHTASSNGREPSKRIRDLRLKNVVEADSPDGLPPVPLSRVGAQPSPARAHRSQYDIGTKVYMPFPNQESLWGEVVECSFRGCGIAFENGDRALYQASEMHDAVAQANTQKPSPTSSQNLAKHVRAAKGGGRMTAVPNCDCITQPHDAANDELERRVAETESANVDGPSTDADSSPKIGGAGGDCAPAVASSAPTESSAGAPPAPTATAPSSRSAVTPTEDTALVPSPAPESSRDQACASVSTVADSIPHGPPARPNESASTAVQVGAPQDSTVGEPEPRGWFGSLFKAVGAIRFPWYGMSKHKKSSASTNPTQGSATAPRGNSSIVAACPGADPANPYKYLVPRESGPGSASATVATRDNDAGPGWYMVTAPTVSATHATAIGSGPAATGAPPGSLYLCLP
jgi:hypothetical protein